MGIMYEYDAMLRLGSQDNDLQRSLLVGCLSHSPIPQVVKLGNLRQACCPAVLVVVPRDSSIHLPIYDWIERALQTGRGEAVKLAAKVDCVLHVGDHAVRSFMLDFMVTIKPLS